MKIALLGDIAIFENGIIRNDWKEYFHDIADLLSKYDVVIANLEIPITSKSHSLVCKGMHLKSTDKILEILKYLNISKVNLSNNHTYDFGKIGIKNTIEALKKYGIDYFGIDNKNLVLDEAKFIVHSFCCYTTNGYGYNINGNQGIVPLTYNKIISTIQNDNKNGLSSILCLHWGDEYSKFANEEQVDLFHELASLNTCVIYGHHTHVMQGIEKCNNSLAAYSLGNFYFEDCISPINKKLIIKQADLNKMSYILELELNNGNIINYNTIGYKYDDYCFKIIDNSKEIIELSNIISNCKNDEYKNESKRMINSLKEKNLPQHNIRWFFSKMNYYSIGAKIGSYINKKRYYNLLVKQLKDNK